MKQKIFNRIIVLLSLISVISGMVLFPVVAQAQEENIIYSEEEWYIAEVFNPNPNETTLLAVEENGDKSYITTNHITKEVFIDGEQIVSEITNISEPVHETNEQNYDYSGAIVLSGTPTINYSTGLSVSHNIAFKGAASLTAALLGLIDGTGWALASKIANAVASVSPSAVIVTYTQYKSNQRYYSNYNGVYYNKVINNSIRTYKNSITSANLVYGPVHGSWFDPIRP